MSTANIKYKKWGIWVYVLLFLSLVSILNVGLYSYNKISESLNNLNSRINQDSELTLVKNIRFNYIKLDNTMDMFLITNKQFYLDKADTIAMTAKKIISTLRHSPKVSPHEAGLLDTVEQLFIDKIRNLNSILDFQQKASLEKTIDQLIIENELQAYKDENGDDRKGLWEKLGLKKKAGVPDAGPKNKAEDDQITVKKEDLFKLTQAESINPFLEKDHELNMHLTELCNIIENIEIDRIEKGRVDSEDKIKDANQSILLLGTITSLFILLAAVAYFRYINRLAEVRKKLAESKELAEEMAIIKERFMANMSHEIRTPMNAISGFVDQLHASNLNIKQKKQIEIIQHSIQHIMNIINDILDFSKLNAGRLTLDYKGFEIEKLMKEIIDLLKPMIDEKNIHFSYEIDDTTPSILIGDAYRLRQILLNIIGNAIKYTDEGSIDVKVKATAVGENKFNISITVTDTGIGIEKSELENIFKEYHISENAFFEKAMSSGLGLSITKMLLELHEGEITIDSTINMGTSVAIQIPYNAGNAMDMHEEHRYANKPDFLQKKKILIADDEKFNRVLLNNILHKYDAETYEAENGLEVLELLEKQHFDCILMDIKMPEMNGLTASERIRKHDKPAIAQTPIIAVSAALTPENFSFLQAIGVHAFLEKPFKEKELMNMLYKIIQKNNDPPARAVMTPEFPNSNKPLFNLTELQKQAGNDTHFINDMLNTLLNSTRKGLEEIEHGLGQKQWDIVNIVSHRIASPMKFIGAMKHYDLLKQIENESEKGRDEGKIKDYLNSFRQQFTQLEHAILEYLKK
ncbi:MAG: response regulator [Bacteroidota bacterium]